MKTTFVLPRSAYPARIPAFFRYSGSVLKVSVGWGGVDYRSITLSLQLELSWAVAKRLHAPSHFKYKLEHFLIKIKCICMSYSLS